MRQYKMQISTLTDLTKTRQNNVETNENCILRKMGVKFKNSSFNILCKIAFWYKQNWLNKELIIWRKKWRPF